MQVHPVLPLGGGRPPVHHPAQALLQGALPPLHERGVRAARGVQPDQAGRGQQEPSAVPGGLRGPDQPDLHLSECSA